MGQPGAAGAVAGLQDQGSQAAGRLRPPPRPASCTPPVRCPGPSPRPRPVPRRAHHQQPVRGLRAQQVRQRRALRPDERALALLGGAAPGRPGQRGLLLELHGACLHRPLVPQWPCAGPGLAPVREGVAEGECPLPGAGWPRGYLPSGGQAGTLPPAQSGLPRVPSSPYRLSGYFRTWTCETRWQTREAALPSGRTLSLRPVMRATGSPPLTASSDGDCRLGTSSVPLCPAVV